MAAQEDPFYLINQEVIRIHLFYTWATTQLPQKWFAAVEW